MVMLASLISRPGQHSILHHALDMISSTAAEKAEAALAQVSQVKKSLTLPLVERIQATAATECWLVNHFIGGC